MSGPNAESAESGPAAPEWPESAEFCEHGSLVPAPCADCPGGVATSPGPAAPESGAGPVSEELVERARRAYGGDGVGGSYSGAWPFAMQAALNAVARDLERAGWERARRECAEELRALIRGGSYVEQLWNAVEEWSSPVTEETPAEETT